MFTKTELFQSFCAAFFILAPLSAGCSDLSDMDLVEGICSNPLLNDCHENADCAVAGESSSYTCTCKEGYVGDGYRCDFADECEDPELYSCPANSRCIELGEGGYKCICDEGFERAGELCRDIDQCADENLHDCPDATVCQNLEDGQTYECTWMVTERATCDSGDHAQIHIEEDCFSVANDPTATALYFNRLESKEDLSLPDMGSRYKPEMVFENAGGYTGYRFEPVRFDNGLKIYGHSRKNNDFSKATITPFTASKPDFSRGTVSFWSLTVGDIAGSVENLPLLGKVDTRHFVTGDLWFHLCDRVYLRLHGPASEDKETIASLVVGGETVGSTTLRKRGHVYYYTLQWNTQRPFLDDTNLKLYIDGEERIAAVIDDPDTIAAQFDPKFVIKAITTYVGEYNWKLGTEIRAKHSKVLVDNVVIWDDIVPPGVLF